MRQRRHPRRRFTGQGRRGIIAAVTLAVGVLLIAPILIGLAGPDRTGATADDQITPEPPRETAPLRAPSPVVLTRSEPTSITIPTIGVDTTLASLPKKKDSENIQLPKSADQAGWFEQSATPGELGITTVIGYIAKSAKEPGVFRDIGKLRQGDVIVVTREDGREVEFTVDSIKFYPEGEFPADDVYAPPRRPELRLITCGGTVEPDDPPGNLVVTARMTGS